MEHRKVVDEREARALLAKAARPGMDLVAVARAHGVDGRSLNAWKSNLERGARTLPTGGTPRRARGTGLIELVPAVVADSPRPRGGGRYTLRVMGAELEFGDDVRADTLRRVLEVLRSC